MELPIEVKLKRPIKLGDDIISVLHFDEPTIGAQIDYAELEVELGMAELREKIAAESTPEAQDQIIPDVVAMRVTQFWIEALADLPKGAARKIKTSDHSAVHAAVDAVLDRFGGKPDGGGSAGNETPAK